MHRATNLSSIKSIDISPEETICDGFDRNELELKHGCLAGSCGVCLIEVVSGTQFLAPAKTIELDTLNRAKRNNPKLEKVSLRLACKAKVIGLGEVQFKKL